MAHSCPKCNKSFVRPAELARHMQRKTPCVRVNTSILSAETGIVNSLEARLQQLEKEFQTLREKQTNALINIFVGQTQVTFTPTQEKQKEGPVVPQVRQIIQQVETHPDSTIHINNPDILMCVVRALGDQQESINVSDFILSPSDDGMKPPEISPNLALT